MDNTLLLLHGQKVSYHRKLYRTASNGLGGSSQILNEPANPVDTTEHIVQLLHAQPLFFCFTFGFLVYGVLIYLFTLNEHAHIRDNPRVQYHLARIKEAEDDFVADRREAYRKAAMST